MTWQRNAVHKKYHVWPGNALPAESKDGLRVNNNYGFCTMQSVCVGMAAPPNQKSPPISVNSSIMARLQWISVADH